MRKGEEIMVLKFKNVEKRLSDSLIFPAFNLHIQVAEVTAIHASLNVENSITNVEKEMPVLNGQILIEDKRDFNRSIFQKLAFYS